VVDKIQETPSFGQRATNWEDTHDGLIRTLYYMLTSAFHRLNNVLPEDGSEDMAAPLPLQEVATADLPSAALWEGGLVYDTTRNRVLYSDGSTWLSPGSQPWLYAADYGVDASNSAATNTTAMNACLTAAAALGGARIYMPRGQLNFNAWDTITTNAIEIHGMGDYSGGTELRFAHATGDSITLSTSGHQCLKDLFISSSVYKTSGYAIKITGGAFSPRIENVRIDYHHNGIWVHDTAEPYIRRIRMRYMHGTQGIYVGGTSSSDAVFGCTIDYFNADNPYPLTYGTFKTWAISTAFSLNDIIQNNGNIYQCSTAGTSSGAGTGPSGIPGSGTPDAAFTTTITDGTAVWKFVASGSLAWYIQDNYAYSCACNDSALLNGGYGVRMIDTAATGTSYPTWLNSTNLELDHNLNMGADLAAGEGFFAQGFWQGSCIAGSGVTIGASFRGETTIGMGSRILGNYTHGVLVQAGPVATNISDSVIALNGQAAAATYNNISLADNAARVCISDNFIGYAASGSGQAAYGVYGGAGVARIIVTGNDLGGNATGGTNLATGGTLIIEHNNV